MNTFIDDNDLAQLDDYWERLVRDETSEESTDYSRPTQANDATATFYDLLEGLDDARRMLQEDSRCERTDGLSLPNVTPALPEQFGRYAIERQLGRGGMGAVFLAHDTQLRRKVALKVPNFSRLDNAEARERFQREARAAATLSHPNICSVYDIGEIDGVPYLTMAYIDGEPLVPKSPSTKEASDAAASSSDTLTSDRDVARLVYKITLALEHAHQQGIVHRDLKPGNVLMDKQGEPIVVDFGLARHLEQDAELTKEGVILGSLAYMSPEQALGDHDRVGPASDIYSLGVILYELLTGQLPYRGLRSRVLGQIVSAQPVELDEHERHTDPRLMAICATALAKRAEERFRSMAEFAQALEAYLGGSDVAASSWKPAALSRTDLSGTKPKSKMSVRTLCAAVLILAMLSIAAGSAIVVTLRTKEGTLVVEVNEPGAKVTVLNEQEEVEVARASDGGTLKLSVDPGKHRLKVEKDGFALFAKEFSIASGETESIKATLVLPPVKPDMNAARDKRDPLPTLSGLIAWWPGEGNAEDSVGRNHGVLQNGVGFAPGVVGQAFKFDGRDDFIRVPNSESLNPKGDFTVELWICPSSSGGYRNILTKWDMNAHDWSYVVQQPPHNHANIFLGEHGHSDLAEIWTTHLMKPGMWFHFAATFDTNTVRLYWNGWLDNVKSVGTGRRIHAGHSDLLMGAANQGKALFFSGLVDEVRFYDRELSNAEIHAIYRAGASGQTQAIAPDVEMYEDVEQKAELANNSLRAKDYATSALLWKEAWQGRNVTRGPHHSLTVDAENLLGEALTKQGKYDEAERHLLDSYAVVPVVKGFPAQWTPIYERRLADLYDAWGKPAEAEKWRAKSNQSGR